jgi:hypothetical protein
MPLRAFDSKFEVEGRFVEFKFAFGFYTAVDSSLVFDMVAFINLEPPSSTSV